MTFSQPDVDCFVPRGFPLEKAAPAVTHLGVGAHQDDLEFMALHGIIECYRDAEKAFAGIVCTNGAGSVRRGPYAGKSDEEIRRIRREEQRAAAVLGDYQLMVQLDHVSSDLRRLGSGSLEDDLAGLFALTCPSVVYTHNPADKHATHLAVFLATIRALRRLPAEMRPRAVYGCEVWRSLDWVPDDRKISFDVGAHADLAAELRAVFQSQIAGGKRYDLAVEGRYLANATFSDSHAADESSRLSFAVDLTPLVEDDSREIESFTLDLVDHFRRDVQTRLAATLASSDGSHHSA